MPLGGSNFNYRLMNEIVADYSYGFNLNYEKIDIRFTNSYRTMDSLRQLDRNKKLTKFNYYFSEHTNSDLENAIPINYPATYSIYDNGSRIESDKTSTYQRYNLVADQAYTQSLLNAFSEYNYFEDGLAASGISSTTGMVYKKNRDEGLENKNKKLIYNSRQGETFSEPGLYNAFAKLKNNHASNNLTTRRVAPFGYSGGDKRCQCVRDYYDQDISYDLINIYLNRLHFIGQ
jgi:hypothetical protein